MSLADSPAAVAAAVKAYAETKPNLTMLNIRQGPGEGNYDRIEEVSMEAALRAAAAAFETEQNLRRLITEDLDEQDTMVMETVESEDEGDD